MADIKGSSCRFLWRSFTTGWK